MDAKQIFAKATKQVAAVMGDVTVDTYAQPTPCSEWDVQALANHMVNELAWVPDLLQGKTIAEVGSKYDGDLLGQDAAAAWKHYLSAAAAAVEAANLNTTVHLSYADVPASHYIAEIGSDILIHSWDLGQALERTTSLNPQLAQAVYDLVLPRADEFKQSGLFGTPVEVAADADVETKLLAFYGRQNKA